MSAFARRGATRSLTTLGRLVWVAMLAGPAAWALQFLFAMQFSLARCESPNGRFQFPVHEISVALGAGGFLVGIAAQGLAFAVFRATRADPGTQDPEDIANGRIHFLSAVALTVNPFTAVICAMVAIGHPLLALCVQS